jgi:uncharacterized protein
MTANIVPRSLPQALVWMCGLLAALLAPPLHIAHARDVPALRAHVNDTAGLLSADERDRLERELSDYEQRTSRQFALLTIDSLGGEDLTDFSMRVVETWKLGKKGKDNGLLLLVVEHDQKLRIEVGYGLEGTVTDAFSSRVIHDILAPALRADAVGTGLERAFGALEAQASREDQPTNSAPPARSHLVAWLVLSLFLLPVLIPIVVLRYRRRHPLGWGEGWGHDGLAPGARDGWTRGGGGDDRGNDRWGGGGESGSGGESGGGGDFGGGGASGSW